MVFPLLRTGPSHWLAVDELATLSRPLSFNYIAGSEEIQILKLGVSAIFVQRRLSMSNTSTSVSVCVKTSRPLHVLRG